MNDARKDPAMNDARDLWLVPDEDRVNEGLTEGSRLFSSLVDSGAGAGWPVLIEAIGRLTLADLRVAVLARVAQDLNAADPRWQSK